MLRAGVVEELACLINYSSDLARFSDLRLKRLGQGGLHSPNDQRSALVLLTTSFMRRHRHRNMASVYLAEARAVEVSGL